MNDRTIQPVKKLGGSLSLKGDKSISHRAVMIASIAEGTTKIKNFLPSDDCLRTVRAFQQLGVAITVTGSDVTVEGKGLRGLRKPKGEMYLGNSGTSMRLISGVLAGQNFESILTGDESLSRRPMDRIIEPLRLMGAQIRGRNDNYAPLTIKGGKLKPIKYKSKVASAQVKSAVIFAGLYADGITEFEEPLQSRDHTERMLSFFGGKLMIEDHTILVYDHPQLRSASLTVPGDISSAAFFIVGSLILDGSEVRIKDVLFNRTRFGIIDVLREMDADIRVENKRFNGFEEVCDIVARSSALKGMTVPKERIPSVIDELPVLLVCSVFAYGTTTIKGAGELRVKETDRIDSMVTALKKMGAKISVEGDDIFIEGSGALTGASVESLGDHRTAMSLVIASLRAKNDTTVKDTMCIQTSLPDFFELLDSISVKK